MRTAFPISSIVLLTLALAICGQIALGQSSQPAETSQPSAQPQQRSASGDVGHGTEDLGKGAAKGTGAAAEGVGKGAGDLVTLHPIDAAGNVGKGTVVASKDVGVGAVKGTGKIAKGTGRGVGKLFHHGHKTQSAPPSSEPQN
jgi:hypothetical protein